MLSVELSSVFYLYFFANLDLLKATSNRIVDDRFINLLQLLRCYVYDCAIDDAIYFLGQALSRGRISLTNYLKEVRQLSRRQFIYRATLQKCRIKAKMPI